MSTLSNKGDGKMFDIEMLGTAEKTESSRFQITLVDKTNQSLHPMDYPRINRFFDNIEERNTFVNSFENSILKSGGKLVHLKIQSHPLFESYEIVDKDGNANYVITIYH